MSHPIMVESVMKSWHFALPISIVFCSIRSPRRWWNPFGWLGRKMSS